MKDTILRVELNTTLKRADGGLYVSGGVFTGTLAELPGDIRRAVEAKKGYLTITELPSPEPVAELEESAEIDEIDPSDLDEDNDIDFPPPANPEPVSAETEPVVEEPVTAKKNLRSKGKK